MAYLIPEVIAGVSLPHVWTEAQRESFAYAMGKCAALPTYTLDDDLVLVDTEVETVRHFAEALGAVGFASDLVDGYWAVDEEAVPIYGAVVRLFMEFKRRTEVWRLVSTYVTRHEGIFIKGILEATAEEVDGVAFFVHDRSTYEWLSRKFRDVYLLRFRTRVETMGFPADVSYPPLEASGEEPARIYVFVFDRENFRGLMEFNGGGGA